jgi:hypothetical protein
MVFTSVFNKSVISGIKYEWNEWTESIYSDMNIMKFIVFKVKRIELTSRMHQIIKIYDQDKMTPELEEELGVIGHNMRYYDWQHYHLNPYFK